MRIILEDKMTFISVQQEFNKVFPYLKIIFFLITGSIKVGNTTQKSLDKSTKTLGEFRKSKSEKNIEITSDMTVAELENQMKKEYGILAQVHRNSGRMWLETTLTDSWTLREQNLQGESLTGKKTGC